MTTVEALTEDERDILRLYSQGLPALTISADLCIPIKDVRTVIREHASDEPKAAGKLLDLQPDPKPAKPRRVLRSQEEAIAAARDIRVDQLIADAAQSHRQRTRTLGARLATVLEDVRRAVAEESAVRAEQQRVTQLSTELAQAKATLKAKLAAL